MKYNDYTYNAMLSYGKKKPKREPSGFRVLANNGECSYLESTSIGYYSGMGSKAQLIKENKSYLLDLKTKKGNVQIFEQKVSTRLIGEGGVPTALGFLIPTNMKNRVMLSEAKSFTYKNAIEETIDGRTYNCEVYGAAFPGLPDRVYKIYFDNEQQVKSSKYSQTAQYLSKG